jgi:hypothetical protein
MGDFIRFPGLTSGGLPAPANNAANLRTIHRQSNRKHLATCEPDAVTEKAHRPDDIVLPAKRSGDMQLIRSIEIAYLRSIHRLRIASLGDLTVFSGANDVGKSNILRALNLFFNNKVNWGEPIDFYQDFSRRRLEEGST